jgi:hypothetical protein
MKKVTIYKITVTKAYVASMELGTRYSLSPWGENTTEYEGYDDGGHQYELPEGFFVAESQGGSLEFYGANDAHFVLASAENLPMLTDGDQDIILHKVV